MELTLRNVSKTYPGGRLLAVFALALAAMATAAGPAPGDSLRLHFTGQYQAPSLPLDGPHTAVADNSSCFEHLAPAPGRRTLATPPGLPAGPRTERPRHAPGLPVASARHVGPWPHGQRRRRVKFSHALLSTHPRGWPRTPAPLRIRTPTH